jgi:hypothetical protein
VIGKLASAASRVALSTLERDLVDVMVRRLRGEPARQDITGHIERDLGRKKIEDLVDLGRQREFSPLNHYVWQPYQNPVMSDRTMALAVNRSKPIGRSRTIRCRLIKIDRRARLSGTIPL